MASQEVGRFKERRNREATEMEAPTAPAIQTTLNQAVQGTAVPVRRKPLRILYGIFCVLLLVALAVFLAYWIPSRSMSSEQVEEGESFHFSDTPQIVFNRTQCSDKHPCCFTSFSIKQVVTTWMNSYQAFMSYQARLGSVQIYYVWIYVRAFSRMVFFCMDWSPLTVFNFFLTLRQ